MTKDIEEIENEAAGWLARLSADRRDPNDEAAFQDWLAQSPAHAAAFEEATDIWELTGGMPRENFDIPKPRRARLSRREVMAGLAVTAVAAGTFSF